jgi:hypothetical protein
MSYVRPPYHPTLLSMSQSARNGSGLAQYAGGGNALADWANAYQRGFKWLALSAGLVRQTLSRGPAMSAYPQK